MKPYYQDDYATIYLGDSREVLPGLGRFDLILTDPPYGVNLGGIGQNNGRVREQYASHDDSRESTLALIRSVWPLFRAASDRIVLTPGVRLMYEYERPDHTGAFYYPAGAGCNKWGFSCWQPILYYGKDPYAGKGSRPDSFDSTEQAEDTGHPCAKPYGQWLRLLNRCSLEGESILDPFMGSGTTLRAAKDLQRRSVGIEIEERYCEIAANRLAQEVLPLG